MNILCNNQFDKISINVIKEKHKSGFSENILFDLEKSIGISKDGEIVQVNDIKFKHFLAASIYFATNKLLFSLRSRLEK